MDIFSEYDLSANEGKRIIVKYVGPSFGETDSGLKDGRLYRAYADSFGLMVFDDSGEDRLYVPVREDSVPAKYASFCPGTFEYVEDDTGSDYELYYNPYRKEDMATVPHIRKNPRIRISFDNGWYQTDEYNLDIVKGDAALKHFHNAVVRHETRIRVNVSAEDVQELMDLLYPARDWADNYSDDSLCDGPSWYLSFFLEEKRYERSGYAAYPDDYDDVVGAVVNRMEQLLSEQTLLLKTPDLG